MAPPNDTAATAQVLPVGAYWGAFAGTTVGADGDIFSDWDAHVVWYTWADLPAGMVYAYVQPDPIGTYLEAALIEGAPTDVTFDTLWAGFGYNDGSEPTRCMLQCEHAGGPLTLIVLTYTPDGCPFLAGWGHQLDADPAHWDATPRSEEWRTYTLGGHADSAHYGLYTIHEEDTTTDPPPPDVDAITCAMANARQGRSETATGRGCPGIQPAAGGVTSGPGFAGAANIGQWLDQQVSGGFFSGGVIHRIDSAGCVQIVWSMAVGTDSNGPISPTREPQSWYAATHGGAADQSGGLNWGWAYTDTNWETTDISLPVGVLRTYDPASPPTGYVIEDCTPELRLVPQSMIAPLTDDFVSPNHVEVGFDVASGTYVMSAANWLVPSALGDVVATVSGAPGTYTPTISGWVPLVQNLPDGSRGNQLIACWVAAETVGGILPTVQSVPMGGEKVSIAERVITGGEGEAAYDYREPDWGTYRGFPLVIPAGWHVGRVAAGGW